MNTDLQRLRPIDFSGFLDKPCADPWCCFLSKCSPLVGREKGRNSYATWLNSEEAVKKGLYIWLHVLPDGKRYRFVHVGLAKKGNSTLASRIRTHCRNAFRIDPTYVLCVQDNDFGRLVKVEQHDERGINQQYAQQFLAQIRVLLLIPSKPDPCAIAQMEGLIAYAAACALGKVQITNTMGRVQPPQKCTKLWELVKPLNAVVPMLPEINQNSPHSAPCGQSG